MTHKRRIDNSQHHEIAALLPWYVNATLGARDRERVDAHVAVCARCREDLTAQQRICAAIEAQPVLDYMPAASLKRLMARLDAHAEPPRALAPPSGQPVRRPPLRAWLAASIAVMAVATVLWSVDRWERDDSRLTEPKYRTVTSSAQRPEGEVIRAVFSPTITLLELQTLLDEAQLRIVSGPTEAGVYSLASKSTLPVRASLALLRRHSSVRFAEGTVPEPDSGKPP